MGVILQLLLLCQDILYPEKLILDPAEEGGDIEFLRSGGLSRNILAACQEPTRSRDGVSPAMEQGLDLEDDLDIRPAIEPLLGVGPFGPNRLKFAFPITEDMRSNVGYFAHFTNLKIEFVRYFRWHIGSLLL
jgi:hypothetical protein